MSPVCRDVLCATRYEGFGLTRLNNSYVSRNLNTTFPSISLFIKQKPVLALVNFICNRMPGSKYVETCICQYLVGRTVETLCSVLCSYKARWSPFLKSLYKSLWGHSGVYRHYRHTITRSWIVNCRHFCLRSLQFRYTRDSDADQWPLLSEHRWDWCCFV